MALLAARRFGRQADLMKALARVEQRITTGIVLRTADSLGMKRSELEKSLKDSALLAAAEASGQEAVRNGVHVTPTIFINGRRYRSYKDPQWVVDAVQFRYDQKNSLKKQQQ